ncbi:MAG: DUF115 domain-containing protein [Treponema sp.]|jgi:hypothetical protein|nr:DUF115 domain-containing protein [Treponema sp.]
MVRQTASKIPALHSRYNPIGEAEKYLNALTFREDPRFFILIEPGRGYMIPLLARKFPQTKILVLHVETQEPAVFVSEADIKIPPAVWEPACGIGLEQFLEREIPDIEASAIQIIEWRPALAVYGEEYQRLLVETANFIKRIDANKRTTRTFGVRWFKNFFKTLGMVRNVIYQSGDFTTLPCVVAGAGPSLEESLPLVKDLKHTNPFFVLGVSAAVQSLRVRGVVPDLIISTDGGGWALVHLYECLRGAAANHPFGLGVSLFGALPSQVQELPLLLISDGSRWQNLILQGLNLPFINLPQRGTVTATALDLAFILTKGNVFITGMDLAHRDICTHARPYNFERFLEEKASRFNPVYSQTFTRSFGILSGGSHSIYADWFGRQLETYPKRLYSLGNNHPVFNNLKPWNLSDWDSKGSTALDKTLGVWTIPAQTNLAEKGVEMLIQALTNPQTSAVIKQELMPLLFPDKDSTTEALCDTVLYITKAYTRSLY